MIEIGVASPRAQGQAMISTVMVVTRVKLTRGSGPKLNEIKKKLSKLPEHKLDEVNDFIGYVLSREKKKKRKIVQFPVFG